MDTWNLLAKELMYKEIAASQGVTIDTIKKHSKKIYIENCRYETGNSEHAVPSEQHGNTGITSKKHLSITNSKLSDALIIRSISYKPATFTDKSPLL